MTGLYIHIPFCEHKCFYCDFVSSVENRDVQKLYVKAVIKEINKLEITDTIDTIFIGGGTPTVIDETDIEEIIFAVKKHFNLKLKEFTIEGNPNSFSKQKIELYKKLGVTRISVGVQTFNDEILKQIGRIHSASQAIELLKYLKTTGLDISVDLMIGLPNQTMEDVLFDVLTVMNLRVTHVSCYSLILEEGTKLFEDEKHNRLNLPDEDKTVDMYDLVKTKLAEVGLERYEISNFGKPCLHNLGYWQFKDYIGVGVSAHSLIENIRYSNTDVLTDYLNGAERVVEETLNDKDIFNEYIMVNLRLEKGIERQKFENIFDRTKTSEFLKKVLESEYFLVTKKNIAIKTDCFYISNTLISDLLI